SEYYDTKIILGDLRLVQRLNEWADSVAGGIQVYIKDPEHAEEALVAIGESMDYDLYIEKTSDTFVQVFEWLALVNRQVVILLGIILTVLVFVVVTIVLLLPTAIVARIRPISAIRFD